MEQSPTIGLVLSGGGSKGAYQAGVYKAMEEKGSKALSLSFFSKGYCPAYAP